MALTGVGIGRRDMPEAEKAQIIAAREAQIGQGGYNLGGTRVTALLGPKAPPETVALVQNVLRATNPRGFMHGVGLGLANGYSPDEVGTQARLSGAADLPAARIASTRSTPTPRS